MRANEIRRPNIVIGAGQVFLDVFDDDGNRTGEGYLGDSVALTINVTETRANVQTGDGPVASELVNKVIGRTMGGSFTLQDMTIDNWSLFVAGRTQEVADAAAPVTDEAHSVNPGKWYQLGTSDGKPMGVGELTSFQSLGSADGNTVYTVDDDYRVDAANARIYIVPGGAIAAGASVHADYTPKASTRDMASVGSVPRDVVGLLRYVEDPVAGKGSNILIPQVSIGASGDAAVKGDRTSGQRLPFTFGVLLNHDLEGIYIDGVPV